MSFPFDQIEFNRNAVQPIECIKAGWDLIKTQYWLFVGMTLVGYLIASFVPFGILMGPMWCGLYLALFQTRRGQPIEFGVLFKGFDFFGDSVIATLLHVLPMMVIIIPAYLIFYLSMFGMMASSNGQPDPTAMMGFFGVFGLVFVVIIIAVLVISVVFIFSYPLIVDRRLSGLNAVKLSIRAGFANFWRLLGMLLLVGLLCCAGLVLCYVGIFLVLPVYFGAIAAAYEQVFGLGQVQAPLTPPPPPSFM
ncbi:MAG TPA: hypothetical protein VIW64_00330 [Pyrinomonadaceae bacterium]|jgi:uncharacterized membrane protein